MDQKQCDKCGETVDEAKAFCPGCGNAFVEEEIRSEISNFDTFEGTLKLGESMYNAMLSDMGLNISKAPITIVKRTEAAEPAHEEVVAPIQTEAAAPVPTAVNRPKPVDHKTKPVESSMLKWLVLGGAFLVFLALLVVVAALVIFMYSSRTV